MRSPVQRGIAHLAGYAGSLPRGASKTARGVKKDEQALSSLFALCSLLVAQNSLRWQLILGNDALGEFRDVRV
jgi:hypothetical protein